MAKTPVEQFDGIDEDATYRRVTGRVLPILIVAYIVGYIDRVNVGFAKLQMLQDLRFSETTYGLGAGIFFLAYVCCELPSNLALARVGARRWLALILIVWGIFSASMAFVRTPWSHPESGPPSRPDSGCAVIKSAVMRPRRWAGNPWRRPHGKSAGLWFHAPDRSRHLGSAGRPRRCASHAPPRR